ncbi:MAG: hypothetical protein JNL70_03765 [Saprospiraceae bacterium]|nr:hypothetical protein [Saprospiraceae bacterium]
MKNLSFYIFALILIFVAASCKKDNTVFIPTGITTIIESDTTWDNDLLSKNNLSTNVLPPLSIEKLVSQLSAEPKIDSFIAEQGGIITLPDNITVSIPANACVTQLNRLCTGKLQATLLILRKKGDFISYNLPTSSSNKQLISGGVVMFRVFQNGQEVKLATGKTIKVRYLMPEPDPQMQLFEGKIDGRFKFDWQTISSVGTGGVRPTVTTWSDSFQLRRGYDMVLDRFGLINCDKFGGDTTSFNSKFYVSLPEIFTNLNTSIYVAFKDMNSVLALNGDASSKTFTTLGRGLPVGRAVTVVGVSLIRDKYYFAKTDVTIQNATQTIRLTPTTVTKEGLKELLNNL